MFEKLSSFKAKTEQNVNARDKLKIGLTYLILIPIDLNMIKEGGTYWSLFQKE